MIKLIVISHDDEEVDRDSDKGSGKEFSDPEICITDNEVDPRDKIIA